ncbi:MAG: homoserine dehydrogenase [Dehalococcoidia bacterium]
MSEVVGISLLGVGNVGGGVLAALSRARERHAGHVGRPLEVRYALVRDASRARAGIARDRLTTEIETVLGDAQTRIVVELMGGEHPAFDYITRALASGRHVVTANKEVMAKRGSELLGTAAANGVRLLYEASVGGGIPIISPLSRDLLANEIASVTAIINGTTNYMLTAMTNAGADYGEVLAEAQRLGYAEPDPTADVEGIDAAYKLAILCGLAFHVEVLPEDISRQGIATLTTHDFLYARELGYTIKLLASGSLVDGELVATVAPTLVASDEPLAKVDGVLNAIQIEADLVGRVVFEGPGAGSAPTASAVLADVLDVARDLVAGRVERPEPVRRRVRVRPPAEHTSRFYIRITVADQAGVLARIAGALGDHDVSIASMIQFEADADERTAELVLTTHLARGGPLRAAINRIAAMDVVREVAAVLPMTGLGAR